MEVENKLILLDFKAPEVQVIKKFLRENLQAEISQNYQNSLKLLKYKSYYKQVR